MVKLNVLVGTVLATGAFITSVAAHPGEHHTAAELANELRQRNLHEAHIKRGLSACAGSPKMKALRERAMVKRYEKAEALRKKRGIPSAKPYRTRRDLAALEAFEAVNHNYTSQGFTTSTDYSTLFAYYDNTSCILTPEVTQGPYYVSGEYIRSDIAEDQEGVPLHIEFQFIDTSTCDAVEDLYVDVWHANATGVYSGVEAQGNGDGYDDPSNLNNTFCRGIYPTDSDGIVAFDTIFVGHYVSRATHIHMTTHSGATINSNETLSDGSIIHTGQIFFPEDLKNAIYALSPYSSDTQAITTNDEDNLAPDAADNDWDPLPDYAYLGDSLDDGLLMWLSIGVDTSASYTISAAAELTADGGVVEGSSGTGGSSNGTTASVGGGAPSGVSMPSGSGGMSMPTGSGGMSGMPGANSTTVASATLSSATTTGSAVTSSGASSSVTSTTALISSTLAATFTTSKVFTSSTSQPSTSSASTSSSAAASSSSPSSSKSSSAAASSSSSSHATSKPTSTIHTSSEPSRTSAISSTTHHSSSSSSATSYPHRSSSTHADPHRSWATYHHTSSEKSASTTTEWSHARPSSWRGGNGGWWGRGGW